MKREDVAMVVVYPVIFTKTNDKKDTILVEIPDLKGFTEGYGLSNAMRMARDYIGGFCLNKPDFEYPEPSQLSDIDVECCTFSGTGQSFASLIDVDIDVYRRRLTKRAVRKNVSLPAWLSEEADRENINVSRVLQEALLEKLHL